MRVWLREPPREGEYAVGLHGDVIPADAYARLLDLDAACATVRKAHQDCMDAARAQSDEILARAESRAGLVTRQAEAEFATAAQRGAEQGRMQALAQWWDEAAAALELRRATRQASRDHVASLVVEAVGRIVRSSSPSDLFARAGQTVDRIIADGASLSVRVHVDDYDAACTQFGALAERWLSMGRAVSLTVSAAPEAAPGTCVCHTDVGTVDASLDVQLRALELAVGRALEGLA